ncbi:ribonuclease H1 isoform X2 [Folsomia candida]|uniref:Ribonuclease H1 n=2 Tax=Folsomia candida TaxID=158441 RepID=A0A226EF43_FOLCA|nr:ribonuclease H1 isoform X2 [Folsomia candida]OXA56000.1 Ribonuclease H1 [Folsomia candida]
MGKKSKGGFYAVARGRQVGVFTTWDDCQKQVNGFANARFKKFESQSEAETFIGENGGFSGLTVAKPANNIVSASSSLTVSSSIITGSSNNKQGFSKSFGPSLTNHVPKESYTVSLARPSIYQFPSGPPSRLAQTRTAILINPLSRPTPSAESSDSTRGIRTSATVGKRGLRVTEDRVTGVKRQKTDANVGVDMSTFQVDEEGYVTVFTDGACSANGKKAAKAGIGVWFGDDHELNISEPVIGRQTNNTAEIQAAERAIVQAKNAGITKLKLKTDSQFTINCVTMWLNKWRRNDYKLANGNDVKNREDLVKLDQAMSGIEIKWSYVQGHKGHYGNERADSLAVAGANK